ncbi:acyl-CoA synthetase [Sinomonas cellulolyticus]|nr:acyl-CoA synthetase [Sinomonas sp. KCTC 49339]
MSPNRQALAFEDENLTYAEFNARVERLSAWLAQVAGITPGDRVAYWGGNHLALLETLFATARIGAVAVLVNARLTAPEAKFILTDSGASVLFFGREQAVSVAEITAALAECHLVDVDAVGSGLSMQDLPDDLPATPEVTRGLEDPAILMYTSGTTGRPKGAVLTHGNLFFNDINVLIETDLRPDEVCLAAAPLFHIAGLNGLVLPTFLKGGTIVIQHGVNAPAMLEAIGKHRVTSLFAVPAMLDALAADIKFKGADLDSLRTIIVGGAPVSERTLRPWADRGVAVQQGYGLTETAPAVLKLAAEDGIRKAGAAGRPQFLVDVRLVAQDGVPATTGEVGEIHTTGPNVIREYWNNPAASAEAFTGGWLRTGDAAVCDEEGYYWIRDRFKDMYVSGGENVYPAEIESALLNVPGVAEAAVIGVPHEKWGEAGKAFIVAEKGTQLTSEGIREALLPVLSRFKVPATVEFRERLPRTTSGKLLKTQLRQH